MVGVAGAKEHRHVLAITRNVTHACAVQLDVATACYVTLHASACTCGDHPHSDAPNNTGTHSQPSATAPTRGHTHDAPVWTVGIADAARPGRYTRRG